jgi:hypothetical protein
MPHPSDGSSGSYGGGELRALAEAMPVRVVTAPPAAPPAQEDADLGWDGFEADPGWDDEDFSRPIGAGVEPDAPEPEPIAARPEPDAAVGAPPVAAGPQRDASAGAAATEAAGEIGDGEGGLLAADADSRQDKWRQRILGALNGLWAAGAKRHPEEADEGGEAPALEVAHDVEAAEGEDDYDIYEARSPIRSHRDAWLGVAWVLAFTALIGWATHLFLDKPDRVTAQGSSVRLDDMRVAEDAAVIGPVSPNEGARRIKVVVIKPETLGGRARSSEYQPEPPYYLSAYTDGEIVSGAYGEFADHNFVLMGAVTSARLLYPDSQFGLLLDQLQAEDPNLVDPQPVPAGTLAGIARCGESKFADRTKAVCFWADEQCMGVITWIDQPLSQAMAEFLALREQIEQQL